MTGWQTSFTPEGIRSRSPARNRPLEMAVITNDYFDVLQTPLRRGRNFQ